MSTSFATGTTIRGTTGSSTRTTTRRHAPARRQAPLVPGAIVVFLAAVFAAFAGRDAWTTFPTLLTASTIFVLADGDVCTSREHRLVDIPLIAGLVLLGLQLVPLPAAVIRLLSPHATAVQDAYTFPMFEAWRPLTVHPAATRTTLSLAVAGALTFWSARTVFARGGRRAALFLLAWLGAGGAVVSVAQRITAPGTLLWMRRLPDPRAMPFGPFVDRNQLATWLLLIIVASAGLLVMETRRDLAEGGGGWRRSVLATARGWTPAIVACLALMLAALAATVSRSGYAGLVVAVAAFATMGRVGERHRAQLVFSTVVLLVILAAFVNAEGLASRVSDTLGSGSTGRLEIWRNTVPIVRDFPIVGIGGGTFADVMLLYQRTERGVLFNHAHNEYLQLLTEGGVLLFALVVIGCSAAIHVARTQLRHDVGPERWMRVGACAAVIGVATQSVWETGLRAPANLLLAAMVAGLALSDPRARRHRSSQ